MALNTDLNLKDYGLYDISNKIFCHITNSINIVNLKSYYCFVVGKEVIPIQREYKTIKINKGFKRIVTDIEDKDDRLKVTFLFVGKTVSFINTNARQFITQIEQCKIKFNTDEYYFDCIIDDWTIEFTEDKKRAIVEVNFNAQAFTETESIKVTTKNKFYTIRGAKDTPLNFKVKALKKLTNFKINEVIIKTLEENETIYIDSFNRKIILNNENAIDKVELFEFPESVGKTEIIVSNDDAIVLLDYKARW